ncbi:MAG: class II aldolase/adducin family protein [Rickettsiales bacterium]
MKMINNHDRTIRTNLAAAYRIISYLKMDDHTYTHLSARSSDGKSFYIYPFGMLFEEVTSSNLIKVTFDGNVIEGKESAYNKTGYIIHGSIYRNRPDINAIFHLHTSPGIAVSSSKNGLLPISQFALHMYKQVSYHNYNSLSLNSKHGEALVHDLGANKVMFLRNHGTITSGKTIQEAMFFTHHLEQACRTQVLCNNVRDVILPDDQTCIKSRDDLLRFEESLGDRDWHAWIRKLDRICPDYKN